MMKEKGEGGFKFKRVMAGDSGVDKFCMLKFLNLPSLVHTIGFEVRAHNIKLNGQSVKLQVKRRLYLKQVLV